MGVARGVRGGRTVYSGSRQERKEPYIIFRKIRFFRAQQPPVLPKYTARPPLTIPGCGTKIRCFYEREIAVGPAKPGKGVGRCTSGSRPIKKARPADTTGTTA